MSDVPPPSLRLKPRARLDGDTPLVTETPPQPTVIPEAATDGSEAPKLRLRPKLDLSTVSPVAEVAAAVQPQIDVEPVKPTFSLKPRQDVSVAKPAPEATIQPVIPASVEPPKFKLKEKSTVESVVPESVIAAPDNAAPRLTTPPPFLVADNPEKSKPSAALPPPVPKLKTARIIDDTTADSDAAPGRSSAKLAVYVLAVLLLGGGFFAYLKLKSKPAPAAPAAPVVAEAPKRPSTPSATLNELSTVPARAIKKAEDTIATVNATEQGRVEAVVDGDQSAAFQPRHKPTPKPVAKPAVTSTTDLAPGIKATTTSTDNVGGDASNEFRTWVAQARVSGVFQGTPPRVLINGRTVSATQLVDETLQITFEGIDATTKTLVFRDRTGATVSRKF